MFPRRTDRSGGRGLPNWSSLEELEDDDYDMPIGYPVAPYPVVAVGVPVLGVARMLKHEEASSSYILVNRQQQYKKIQYSTHAQTGPRLIPRKGPDATFMARI